VQTLYCQRFSFSLAKNSKREKECTKNDQNSVHSFISEDLGSGSLFPITGIPANLLKTALREQLLLIAYVEV
jgi:hypothetical protein